MARNPYSSNCRVSSSWIRSSASAVAIGEHQIVGNIHQRELHRHDAFADGAGKGFALGKIEDVGWIGDQFFHEFTIPG